MHIQVSNAEQVIAALKKLGTAERAKASAWYFKTGKGEYGFGDEFIGVAVPDQRKVAKQFSELPLAEIKKLLREKLHECRLTALLILVAQYKKADEPLRKKIANFFLAHKKQVNNWDLVDSSAPYILGHYLLDKPKDVLYKLAASKSIWDRRIAIISTMGFIRANQFEDTLRIAQLLLQDKEDLIHKAAGWMLKEVGERSVNSVTAFLKKHAEQMPRTMLRYAIEKFPEAERRKFLAMGKKPGKRS